MRAPPYCGSPQTGWPIAARCARIWCVRPVSSRTRSSVVRGQPLDRPRSGSPPRAAGRCGWTSTVRRARSRPDRGVDRAALGVQTARPPAPGTRAAPRARAAAPAAPRGPASVLATTSRPDVSRSRRCTIPARSGSAPPAARPRSASARVGPRCPGAGCVDQPGGLVHHQQVVVLVDDLERAAVGRPARGARPPVRRPSPLCPAADAVALRPRPPVHRHRARLDQPLAAARARAPRRAARNASRRSPASSAAGDQLAAAAVSSPPPRTEQHEDARSRCTSRPR